MGSSTHAGAVQSRKTDKHRTEGGPLARLVNALGFGPAAPTEPDILDTLQAEHRIVQGLLDEMLAATTAAKRATLFRTFKTALVKHARAEEDIVYARLIARNDKDSKIAGHEGAVEHGLADFLIAQAMKIRNKMSPEWTATVQVLSEILNHHIREEEGAIFSEVRDHIKADERRRMNADFESEKKKIRA